MSNALLHMLAVPPCIGKRVRAKYRYIVWAAMTVRLCVPVGAILLPPLVEVSLPAGEAVITPADDGAVPPVTVPRGLR